MKRRIESLSDIEAVTLARVRLSVTAHLVAEAAEIDESLATLCARPFNLALAAIGVRERARLTCQGGRITAWFGQGRGGPRGGAAGGTLLFPSARSCARSLAGGGGMIIPLPSGTAFPRALRFFKAAAGRAPELLRSPGLSPQGKARLLLAASVHGIAAVAGDPYLEKRMRHFPDGIVRIEAGNSHFLLQKKAREIRILGGDDAVRSKAPGNGTASTIEPDAILAFASPESAMAVLSGKRQAVVALGSGEVSLAGLLPLVQGLFSVLDRLSWYLAVSSEGGGA